MIEGGSPNQMVFNQWSSTGKEDTGDVGLSVVGEGMGRGNVESITANAMIMTMRPTNVTETNQYPVFVAYHRSTHVPTCLEARVYTH